jgi:predicted RNase H-like nuclease (RuvC/YqgF family)
VLTPTKYSNSRKLRTQVQNKGIDFDVEVGARDGHAAVSFITVDLKR